MLERRENDRLKAELARVEAQNDQLMSHASDELADETARIELKEVTECCVSQQ